MKSGMYNREIFWPDDLEEAVQDFFSRKMTICRVSNRKKEGQDMIFPISFCWDPYLETFVAIVKTVWENNSEDHHPTKDIKKYVQS